ncbi:MAG: hypothetical protein P8Y43_05965 [Sulfurovaceae bacterium]
MKKTIFILVVVLLIGIGIDKSLKPHSDVQVETSNNISQLTPGKTLRLEVPQFLADDNKQRVFEVRIPETYRPDKNMPLLVWFSPGGGSNRISSIPPIVDKTKFLLVALPYPDNQLPRLAIKSGSIDSFWDYEKPMLEYTRTMITNIDPKIRIAAGFSSGAHLVGSGLDRDWNGFTDFFTVYVMHEGGGSPDNIYKGVKSSHKLLVTYGLQNNSYGQVVVSNMKKSAIFPDVIKLPHTGHAMSQESIDAIRHWIDML